MEVVRNTIGDDCVTGIVTALGAAADLRLMGEDVGELALAFVAPLGAEDNCDGHVRRGEEETDAAAVEVLITHGTREMRSGLGRQLLSRRPGLLRTSN